MRSTPESWRKSSYSGGSGGDCLEVAIGHPAAARDHWTD
ncbi:DUF397 domain-containing protein [Streptomyces sviceus]